MTAAECISMGMNCLTESCILELKSLDRSKGLPIRMSWAESASQKRYWAAQWFEKAESEQLFEDYPVPF